MRIFIVVILIRFMIGLLIQYPVFADETSICKQDYDISTIPKVIVDEGARHSSNEIEITIDRPIDIVFKFVVYAPLEIQIRGTDALPGVRSTKTLNNKQVGERGYVRVVCLNDGNTAIEEVIENIRNEYFSYKVWDYTFRFGKYIEYAKGEWWFTPKENKTHIRWRYSFKLDKKKFLGKLGPAGRWLFKIFFLRTRYNDFMIDILNTIKKETEKTKEQRCRIL